MNVYLRRWLHHAALNAGDGLRLAWLSLTCFWYVLPPPQWHHGADDVEGFDRHGVWWWFRNGLGYVDE